MQAALSDPMVLAAGLQIVRTIGLKRIVPIIAIGGIALGLMASRRQGDAEPSSEE
jgi:thiamine monophosphate synthase